MLVNKVTDSMYDKVFLAIFLNFAEGNKHGCSKNCSFCTFKLQATYMCPTKKDVIEYITTYKERALKNILLSGGGDPLYNFEKNKEKIIQILNAIQECGFKVTMQSYELDIIDKYWDTLFTNVDTYYFSVEGLDSKLLLLADKLLANGKEVHISKVVNFSTNVNTIDWAKIFTWIQYYQGHCTKLHFHENYCCCLTPAENSTLYLTFKRLNLPCDKYYHVHRHTRHKHLALINNEVWSAFEYIHAVLLKDFQDFKEEDDIKYVS